MKNFVAFILLLGSLAVAGAWIPHPQDETRPAETQQNVAPSAPPVPVKVTTTFVAYDVFIDSGVEALAAYQVELKDAAGRARIVGIEGGAPSQYAAPPHYDPKAMQSEHVIIGAYSTAEPSALPSGKIRVARIHVMSKGGEPVWQSLVMTAGAPGGRKIDAKVMLEQVQGDGK